MGDIHEAIDFHETSKQIATEFGLKDLEAVAFLNIGLCQIDIWEIQLAIKNFEKCIKLTENTNRDYTVDSFYCLSFLNSVIGCKTKSIDFATQVFQELDLSDKTSWSSGYRWLFLGRAYMNLSNLEKSFEMYKNALSYSEESHYLQVKANSLSGLATIKRMQNDWEQAISYHHESIDILKLIGARCDLAEAYFQLGLTHQTMGKHDQAEECKAEALKLFAAIKAPKH